MSTRLLNLMYIMEVDRCVHVEMGGGWYGYYNYNNNNINQALVLVHTVRTVHYGITVRS